MKAVGTFYYENFVSKEIVTTIKTPIWNSHNVIFTLHTRTIVYLGRIIIISINNNTRVAKIMSTVFESSRSSRYRRVHIGNVAWLNALSGWLPNVCCLSACLYDLPAPVGLCIHNCTRAKTTTATTSAISIRPVVFVTDKLIFLDVRGTRSRLRFRRATDEHRTTSLGWVGLTASYAAVTTLGNPVLSARLDFSGTFETFVS